MNEPNPYRAPEATLVESGDDTELAGRGTRLISAILDTLLMIVILVPIMFVGGYFETIMSAAQRGEEVSLGVAALWGLIGLVVFIAVQSYPLATAGQTWGKKLMGIKIVDLEGRKPPLGRLLGLRYVPVHVVANVPLVGSLAALVNVLFIFRDDRRCVHDLIAGTKVVMVR